jgi:hypothetical protein
MMRATVISNYSDETFMQYEDINGFREAGRAVITWLPLAEGTAHWWLGSLFLI